MSHKQTAKQLVDALSSGKSLEGNPELAGRIMLKSSWSDLGIPPAELPLVAGDRDAWRCQFELLPPQPQKNKQAKENALN